MSDRWVQRTPVRYEDIRAFSQHLPLQPSSLPYIPFTEANHDAISHKLYLQRVVDLGMQFQDNIEIDYVRTCINSIFSSYFDPMCQEKVVHASILTIKEDWCHSRLFVFSFFYSPLLWHVNAPPNDPSLYPSMMLSTEAYVPGPRNKNPTKIRKTLKMAPNQLLKPRAL